MQDQRNEPTRPTWRRNETPPPRREREPSGYQWPGRAPKPVGRAKGPGLGSYRIAAAVLGFLACLVAVVVLIILIWPPDPVGILLVGADYADNLAVPHNVLGWKGIEGIAALAKAPRRRAVFSRGSLRLVRDQSPEVIDHRERWDVVINELATKGFSQPTLLIAVGLHGGSDAEGAYLIPDRMERPEERLDLATVIESMKKLPPQKQKILVLEPAQVPDNWRLGMLHNDFASRLEQLEPEIRDIDNLWVLSACDVDQRCWASEGLGRTVFSHFLIEGLQGKAAGRDGQLTLAELHQYVRDKVRDWVWEARGAIQEPVLLPRAGRGARSGEAEDDAKPKPKAGKAPARKSSSNVVLVSVEPAAAPAEPRPPDLDPVRRAWQGFHRLDAMVPHPSAYSPRRWREYRAALVRYEELVRAGGEGRAGPVRERIDALARKIEDERILDGLSQSAENTLAMRVVSGGRLHPDSAAVPEDFLRFWNAGASEAVKLWDGLATTGSPSDDPRPTLRMRADDFLLRRAIVDTAKNVKIAADRLLITARKSGLPQPAEAHFLRMLALWPDALAGRHPRVWRLASQALEVRRLAERAAVGAPSRAGDPSYSEQVYPWIRSQIEAGDRQRRLGEDLFFSSEPSAWDGSEKALQLARSQYETAGRRAEIVQAALAARDRSLAMLPEYSRWVGHRYSDELENELPATVEDLWEKIHALTERLEKPRPDGELGSLERASKALAEQRGALEGKLVELVHRIDAARSKEDWEAATAAAAIPFSESGEPALRSALWARLANIRDHDREPASSEANSGPLTDTDRARAAKHARRRAQIQGLMALSALGARWFNDERSKSRGEGDFEATVKRVRRLSEATGERAETWRQDLAEAGDAIGQRWRGMTRVIDDLKDEERGITKFGGFEDRLTEADRLGRQIDGAAPPLDERAVEAPALLRKARVHDLLLTLAERARLDHWYDEDPKDTPYYRVVGSRFVKDALYLFPNSPLAQATQKQLEEKGELKISGLPLRILTSEPSAGLAYEVVAEGAVPEGLPVVKPVPDRLLELQGDGGGFRTVERGAAKDEVAFFVGSPLIRRAEIDPKLNRPRIEETALRVEGSFRGQPLTCRTDVFIHPVPDTVAIGPPPPRPPEASLAVHASQEIIDRFGEGTGSIAIVLDCSGSMVNPNPSKFEDAKNALRQVLAEIHKGTKVSLWTFSQVPPGVAMVPDGNGGFGPSSTDPVAVRAKDEPERTIDRQIPPTPWGNEQLAIFSRRLDGLQPYFETPLVQAMWTAADNDLRGAKGIKTLLVLTDGEDNRFAKNLAFNRDDLKIPEFIEKYFKPLGVRIHMVFFTPAGDPAELERAKKDFTDPLKRLDPPGSFSTAKDLRELIARLSGATRQRLTCEILEPPRWGAVNEEALEVTGPGDADKWWTAGLEPRTYKLRVHADKPYEQEVDLREGERMIVELVDGENGGIAFRRALYSDRREFDGRRATQEAGPWRLAVLANQRRTQGDDEQLRLFATLERRPGESGAERLRQVEPRRPWFRLDAQDVERPEAEFTVRWRERISYPGPAWQIDVPHWIDAPAGQGLARPILRAWWQDPEPRGSRDCVLPLHSPGDPGVLPPPLQVEDGKTVTIESLDIEDHRVEVQPDQPTEEKPCLVIRLEFPKGRPYIVDPGQLAGLNIVGYEHRLYSRAGKYMGLFWPVSRAQLSKLNNIGLISLAATREQAEKEKRTAEVKLLAPRDGDQLPVPPPAIVKEK